MLGERKDSTMTTAFTDLVGGAASHPDGESRRRLGREICYVLTC